MPKTLLELINEKKQQIDASKRPNAKRIPDGRSRLRILPGWRGNGDNQFWQDYGQHYIKDAGDTTKAVYICVSKTFGRPCDVCNAISLAAKSVSDDALAKVITDARATSRILVNALHIDGPNPTVPDVYEIPPTVFEQYIGLSQLYLNESVDIIDLKNGFDVSIERTGKGLTTKYTLAAAPKSSSVNPEVMSKVQNLDKYVSQENENSLQTAISEVRALAGLGSNGVSTSLSLPLSTTNLLDVDEDLTLQIPTSISAPSIGVNVIDVDFTESTLGKVVETAKAETAKVTEAVKAVVDNVAIDTGDAELDELLAKLNG